MATIQQQGSWEALSSPHRTPRVRQSVNRGFNVNIHGARGFLAFLVFIFHVSASGAPGFAWQTNGVTHAVLSSLQLSVEVFFCISGYVVTGTLERAHGPVAYLRNRVVRILPVLWITLAIVVPLGLLTHQGGFETLSGRDLIWVLPANMIPIAGVFPIPVLHLVAWSLSYELMFYVIAATLWWLPAARHLSRSVVILIAIGLVIWHPKAIFFVIGVCAARSDLAALPWIRHATRAPGVMLIGFFIFWYWAQSGGAASEPTFFEWVSDGRVRLAALAIAFGTVAFGGIVAGQGWLGTALRTAPLQRLGTLSFSFYLWHVIVIGVAKRVLAISGGYALFGPWSQVMLVAVCLPVSLLVAAFSARWLEQGFFVWPRRRQLPAAITP